MCALIFIRTILFNIDIFPLFHSSGFILTCCSYITGPGVELELDRNNNAWDMIYRKRISNIDTQQLVLEAQARLLRRVDEENLDKWKTKLEEEVGKK